RRRTAQQHQGAVSVSRHAQYKVFSIVFGVAYMGLFFYSEATKYAMFRYYPVLGTFTREALPLETAGPPILWYSWLAGAAVVAVRMRCSCRARSQNESRQAGSGSSDWLCS